MDSRRFGTSIAALALACLGRIAIAAQGNPEAAKVKNPVAATPESVAAGKQVFQRNCAPCHGTTAEGGAGNDLIPAAPNLTDDTWDHGSTEGEIFDAIKNGVAPDFNMIPWKDQLKDPDIWNVVNYMGSITKKNVEADPKVRLYTHGYFASELGRIWNFTSLLVVPLPPSMWNGARVAYGV